MAREVSPLSTPLSSNYGSIMASYDNVDEEEVIDRPDEGKVPMFVLFGPKLKLKRVFKLYYFILVFMIFRVYYKNGGVLIPTIMKLSFFPKGSNESENAKNPFVFDHPFINHWFQSFGFAIPGMLSLIIAYVADYFKYQRANLINCSLGISSFSAFVTVICGFIFQYKYIYLQELQQALSIIVLISFVLGLALYLPTSLAYGLDILQGTSWKVIYLFFPLMYFVNNIIVLLSYSTYLDVPDYFLPYNCLVNLVIVLLAWVLCIIGRSCGCIPNYDQTTKVDITLREAFGIIWYALKERMSKLKAPPGHWFLQIASEKYYGKFKHEKVQIVSSFLRLIFLLSVPLVAYMGYQMVETGFPNQGYMLTMLNLTNLSQHDVYCKDHKYISISDLTIVNRISIIIAIPFFEYFFWNVTFYVDAKKEPFCVKCIKVAKIRKCVKRIQNFVRDYFHPLDPILKKMFWGLLFGLFSIICAFYVEIARVTTIERNYNVYECENSTFNHTYKISGISIFSQVPQYVFSGLLEVLLYVGVQQFIYFQCYTTFKDAFKSFFMSLYYFNISMGIMVANIVYVILDQICNRDCADCVIYSDTCSDQNFGYAWLVWMVFIILYVILIVILGISSHYRYWEAKMLIFKGVDYDDHMANERDIEG